jgi:L-lactate dehydrogenase complex protein LldE
MKVGLFIPCYVDQLYPNVGLATVEVLERHGVEVDYPEAQTCCGQPMANSGCVDDARLLAVRAIEIFSAYDHIVCPSGSCVSMVRHHYRAIAGESPRLAHLETSIYELCEFLVDVLGVKGAAGAFPHRVGLHQSCHGLRELRLASGSERRIPAFNKVLPLLGGLGGIELVELARPDECCGFGGTFAVNEEAVSCLMGKDRIADHQAQGAEIIAGIDMSCLMHMEGLLRRTGQPTRVRHVAELLAGEA